MTILDTMKNISLKLQLSLFLTSFLIFLSFQESDIAFFTNTIISLVTCVVIDSLFYFAKAKKFKITESSLITGLIIGFVLSSSLKWWFFILAAGLAIITKHLIRINNKHIFNPAALGIFLVIAIFKQATQWHGAYSWYIIIPFGLYFVWRIKKITIVSVYLLTYILLSVIQSHHLGTSILNQIFYANYFFIFVMLIEPRTSPFDLKPKIAYGVLVGVFSFILQWFNLPYDTELAALLIGNLVLNLYNKRKEAKNGEKT